MWHRAATNPTYDEIVGKTTDSFFRHIPMAWYVVGVPVLVGLVYYALQHRRIHTAETVFERRLASTGGLLGAEPLGHVLGEPVTDSLGGKMVNR
jgi:hypothetical protein